MRTRYRLEVLKLIFHFLQSRMMSAQGPSYTFFTGDSITIHDGVFNQIIHGGQQEFASLANKTSPSAFHNTKDSQKCHPNTRIAILDRLKNWINGTVEPNASILWLNGEPGFGKSCIASSIAEWCEQRQQLLASFFFLKTDVSRNSAEYFITSLSYAIAQTVPSSRPHIEHAIRSDPHIFTRTMDIQMDRLIVGPLHHLQPASDALALPSVPTQREITHSPSTQRNPQADPRVLVIDGLDECINPAEQRDIIRLFASTFDKNPGWKILITSRSEEAIRTSFDSFFPAEFCSRIDLVNEYNSNVDIAHFLVDKFAEIKKTYFWEYSIPTDWPSSDDINKLVSRSCGQFIYAAALIKHITSSQLDNPVDRLRSILDKTSGFPDTQRDSAVYAQVLQTSFNLEFWL